MAKVLSNIRITQHYGHNGHTGVDIGATSDRKVYANADGVVEQVQTGYGNKKGSTGMASYGNMILIKHPNGMKTRYAHLQSVNVKKGQSVKAGQQIGVQGNTGNSYGTHLHYEVYNSAGKRINPEAYIQKAVYSSPSKPSKVFLYCAYDNVKNQWLPKVKTGTKEYAGNFGNGISGFKMQTFTYRAHDKVKRQWLPWVTGDKDYAGNLPNDIDAIQIRNADYRVHDKVKKQWLPWVHSTNDYAGNLGNSIDAIQIK